MRKYFLYLLTFVFAFVAGVAVVWIWFQAGDLEDTAVRVTPERFNHYAHACGNGYIDSYITDDDQYVSEGIEVFDSPKEASREFRREIPDATLVQFTGWNNDERKGERRILVGNETDGAIILLYDGTDHIRVINAPNEALAREFEQYLISNNIIVDLRSIYETK